MTGPPPSGQPQSSPKRPPRPPARPAKQDTDVAAVGSSTENGSHSSTAAAWDGGVLKSENDSYKFVNIASDAVPPAAAPNGGFVPRKKLSSFTSEPPQTLLLMRQWAQEEEAHLQQQQPPASPPGGGAATSPTAAVGGAHLPALRVLSASSNGGGGSTPTLKTFQKLPTTAWLSPRAGATMEPHPLQKMAAPVNRRFGHQLLADRVGLSRGVSNHHVAGDLFVGEHRRRNPDDFTFNPLPADQAEELLLLDAQQRRARAPGRMLNRSSSPLKIQRREGLENKEDEEDGDGQMDLEFDEDHSNVPYYKKSWFWKVTLSVAFTAAFMMAGILMSVFNKDNRVSNFSWWRLLIFISTWVPIWWAGTFFGRLVIWVTESQFFTAENILYFVYTVRKPLAMVLRSALLLISWSASMWDPIFSTRNDPGASSDIKNWYDAYLIILKLLVCLLLIFVAELLKVFFAKMIASKFTRDSHVSKMNSALRKERHLHALLQPRVRPWHEESGGFEEYDEDGGLKKHGSLGTFHFHRRSSSIGRGGGSSYMPTGASLKSWWNKGSTKHRTASMPRLNLDPIEEEAEDLRSHSDTPVVVNIGSGSPQRLAHQQSSPGLLGDAPLGDHSPGGGLLKQGSLAAGGGAGGAGGSPLLRSASFGGGSGGGQSPFASAAGGGGALFQQDSPHRAGSTLRQRSPGGRSMLRTSSRAGGGGLLRPSTSSGQGLRRGSVNSAGAPSLAPAPKITSAPSTLDTSSTNTLMRKGPVAIAAKMARCEKHIRKKALQVTFYDEIGKGEQKAKVTNDNEAKRLAFYLFYNVKTDFDRPYITIDDLEGIMSEKEAREAFAMLDEDGNGKVTLAECATAVMNIFKEREYLAASLSDTKNIVGRLAFMIGVGLHIVFFFIYLLIMGIDAWKVFVAIVPVLGAVSFALGSSVKQAVDSSVFLFMTHPYDVGDIIVINDFWYMVEEITLPCTVVVRTADSAKIWYPNTELMAIPLYNLTVSPNLNEISTFVVNANAPSSLVEDMKMALREYAAENPQDFSGKVNAWYGLHNMDLSRPNRLNLSIKMEYNYNFLGPRCFGARSGLFHFVINKLAEWKVEVTNVVQPVALYGPNGHAAPLAGGTWGLGQAPNHTVPPPANPQ